MQREASQQGGGVFQSRRTCKMWCMYFRRSVDSLMLLVFGPHGTETRVRDGTGVMHLLRVLLT